MIVGTKGGLQSFAKKLTAYRDEETVSEKPKNLALMNRVEGVRVATLADLSFGELSEDSVEVDTLYLVELWFEVEATGAWFQHLEGLKQSEDLVELDRYLGLDRHVVLASVRGGLLRDLALHFSELAEIHLPPTVEVRASAPTIVERQGLPLVDTEFAGSPPRVTVAVHDTGVDVTHPLLAPLLSGASSVVPGEGEVDEHGHGTKMSGLAVYGDLAHQILSGSLQPASPLVSIKYLRPGNNSGVLWAERTREAIGLADSLSDTQNVVHNLSCGAPNEREHEPTAWSVALDRLAWNSGLGRLIVVSAGNVAQANAIVDARDYPVINLGTPLTDPAQAWNVTTAGGVTHLVSLSAADLAGGMSSALASGGQVSPHSATGPARITPSKPDVVAEAGNTAPDGLNANVDAAGLTLLSTGLRSLRGRDLERASMTSAAAALTTNSLARIWDKYPHFTPATVRGLLIHGAEIEPASAAQMPNSVDLRRTFGNGTIDWSRAAMSSRTRPVLVFEGSLQPRRTDFERKIHREVVYVELPFPEESLSQLGESEILLEVTLSYFVEPSESERRSTYAGARLRWDMQGPNEPAAKFRQRVNKLARGADYRTDSQSYAWAVGADNRSRSTLQHDAVITNGSAVAGSRLVAIYPVLGWWENRAGWHNSRVPFSLIASIESLGQEVDLYSEIQASLPVSVDAT